METKPLSIKKSIKLLKNMVVWATMAFWIMFMIALLSTKASAQSAIQVDNNLFRVNNEYGWFHVDSNGRYSGAFMQQVEYPNGDILTITGEQDGATRIGKHVYKINNEIVVIRHYNRDGVLVRSTRIRPKREVTDFASN